MPPDDGIDYLWSLRIALSKQHHAPEEQHCPVRLCGKVCRYDLRSYTEDGVLQIDGRCSTKWRAIALQPVKETIFDTAYFVAPGYDDVEHKEQHEASMAQVAKTLQQRFTMSPVPVARKDKDQIRKRRKVERRAKAKHRR